MTELEKAARQALEALESYHGYMEPLTTVFGGPRVPAEQSTTGKVEKAITALRRALEQQRPERLEELLDTFKDVDQCGPLLGMGREQQTAEEPPVFVNADHLQGLTLGHYGSVEIYTDESEGRIPLYARPQPAAPDDELTQALIERDETEAMADELAAKIAEITGDDIGEHTSGNCPWQKALEVADDWINRPQPAAPAADTQIAAHAKRLALELECLLLSCEETAVVSKWWASAHQALGEYQDDIDRLYSPEHVSPFGKD